MRKKEEKTKKRKSNMVRENFTKLDKNLLNDKTLSPGKTNPTEK